MLLLAETKKVAILETVDKEGKISYAHKLMLRSSLAKAITEAPGYEAYDRVDTKDILDELKFQRTGLVSDSEIRKVGAMAGAQYVMIAEAVMVDASNMFITAKIIDVESAQTMKAESQLMKATPEDIQIGCTTMAGNLLGIKLNAGITKTSSSSSSTSYSSTPSATPTPVRSTTSTSASKTYPKPTITWEWMEDCSVTVKKCYAKGNRLYLQISLTNNSGKDFKYCMYSSYIKIYDSNGNMFDGRNGETMLTIGNNSNSSNCSYIPDGVSMTALFTANYTTTSNKINLIEIDVNHGETYGNYRTYRIKIKNVYLE